MSRFAPHCKHNVIVAKSFLQMKMDEKNIGDNVSEISQLLTRVGGDMRKSSYY